MTHELKRFDPLRTANVSAVVYGLMMTIFTLIFLPFFLLIGVAGLVADESGAGLVAMIPMALMLVFYPIFGFIFGWISGLLGAAIYNFVVRWTGGFLVDVTLHGQAPPQATPAPTAG